MSPVNSFLLTESNWEKIREAFSEPEKELLNRAIVGEVLCPRGAILDEALLDPILVAKTKSALAALGKS